VNVLTLELNLTCAEGVLLKAVSFNVMDFSRSYFFVVYSKSFKRVRKIVKSHYYLCHIYPSVCLSAWNNSASTGRIFIKFHLRLFLKSLSIKFKFYEKNDKNNEYFT